MLLHYYTPVVPESYCVGVHNGHGFGSLFARLFSKVAAKTAAKAAIRVAKSAGRRALRHVTKQAPKLIKSAGQKALRQVTRQAPKLVKEAANTALQEGSKAVGSFVNQKIEETKEKVLRNTKLPPPLINSIAKTATGGVTKLQSKAVPKLISTVNSHIDNAREKIEKASNIKNLESKKRKSRRKNKIVRGKVNRTRVINNNRLEKEKLNNILHNEEN